MSHSIQCVHCNAVLKSATAVPAGRNITCPKCKKAFTTPSAAAEKSYAVECTHCQAVLKSPTPIPAGKKVTCPKCKQAFTTPGAAPPKKAEPALPPPKVPLNISIFTGDADAAIADLMAEAGPKEPAPNLDDELVTEEDVEEVRDEGDKTYKT